MAERSTTAGGVGGGGGVLVSGRGLEAAVALVNKVDPRRLELLVGRLIARLGDEAARSSSSPFLAGAGSAGGELLSGAEQEQLGRALSLAPGEVRALVAGAGHAVEQAAYHRLSPPRLSAELQGAGMSEPAASAFRQAWSAGAASLVPRLEARSLAPLWLARVSWRLHLLLARSDHPSPPPAPQHHLQRPAALFHLSLRTPTVSTASSATTSPSPSPSSSDIKALTRTRTGLHRDTDAPEEEAHGGRTVTIEMTHDELYNFFLQLEAIQEQLDALG